MTTSYVVVSTEGMKRLADGGLAYRNTLDTALFVNNHTPVYSDAADFSWATEASFSGYARVPCNFAASVTNASPPDADSLDTLHTWTASGSGGLPQTVYGWALIDPADGKWIAASYTNLSPPQVISAIGGFYQVQPRVTFAPYAAYP
jgi:hypothetical protein